MRKGVAHYVPLNTEIQAGKQHANENISCNEATVCVTARSRFSGIKNPAALADFDPEPHDRTHGE